MIRHCVYIILLLICPGYLSAQIGLEIQYGYGRSVFDLSIKPFCKPVYGKYTYFNVQKDINEHFSLKLGVGFENKGFIYRNSFYGDVIGDVSTDYRLRFLGIPLILDYKLNNYLFFGGLYGSFILKATAKENGNYIYNNVQKFFHNEYPCTADFKDDFGMLLGVGYCINLSDHWQIPLRITQSFGFRNIDRNDNAEWKNSVNSTAVSFGIKYIIGEDI